MKKVLIFDTETTGLPLSFAIPAKEDPTSWPNLVQLSAKVYDLDTESLLFEKTSIIKPYGGVSIPNNMIHGITHQQAIKEGIDISVILQQFYFLFKSVDLVVCHNYEFDSNVMEAAYLNNNLESPDFVNTNHYCTMKNTTNLLKIPRGRGYKYPSLEELYYFLFKENFTGAHRADNDVDATARCFFKLKETIQL